MVNEHIQFHIPTADADTPEGLRVGALAIPGRNGTLHGFLSLPKTVSAEDVELVIRAMRACLADLEDNCHNHPTQPMRPFENGSSGSE